MIDEKMILSRIEDLIEQISHTGREAEHLRNLQLMRGQQEFSDAEQRADYKKTREHTRVNATALIDAIYHADRLSDRAPLCRQLREVLGLVEQPDLPPADTAGGE
jgi:hypothetical protein